MKIADLTEVTMRQYPRVAYVVKYDKNSSAVDDRNMLHIVDREGIHETTKHSQPHKEHYAVTICNRAISNHMEILSGVQYVIDPQNPAFAQAFRLCPTCGSVDDFQRVLDQWTAYIADIHKHNKAKRDEEEKIARLAWQAKKDLVGRLQLFLRYHIPPPFQSSLVINAKDPDRIHFEYRGQPFTIVAGKDGDF